MSNNTNPETVFADRARAAGMANTTTTTTAAAATSIPPTSSNHNDNNFNDNSASASASHDAGNSTSGEENNDKQAISMQELIYGASSFHAIIKPVCITMILAALAEIYINTDETKAKGEQALARSYQVFEISDDQSAATSIGLGLFNSLVIVAVIGCLTFVIVLLYKYRCMKLLIGYMVIASTMLLAFLGGQMFIVAINKYDLPIDKISFYVTMYNFSIVGVLAIFYQKGIPTVINQSYLVATSVIVAWQLSYFNDWMAWALLIMLALYDLFAVLTPCGPLKALVNLMSKDDAPMIPGLLYEARLPENATRPGGGGGGEGGENGRRVSEREQQNVNSRSYVEQGDNAERSSRNGVVDDTNANTNGTTRNGEYDNIIGDNTHASARGARRIEIETERVSSSSQCESHVQSVETEMTMQTPQPLRESIRSTTLPLAIAKVYKLPIVDLPGAAGIIASLDTSSPTAYLHQQPFSAGELQTEIEVALPRSGGRIETMRNNRGEARYVVYNREGEIKRTLLVDVNGKVMEVVPRSDDLEDVEDNTIKLGLGDFIFYSVLVTKAAGNGFASFLACFLSILTGLGGTLVLLAVYHKALPALPISIFLAVIMFLLTISCMEPWIQDMWKIGPYYV